MEHYAQHEIFYSIVNSAYNLAIRILKFPTFSSAADKKDTVTFKTVEVMSDKNEKFKFSFLGLKVETENASRRSIIQLCLLLVFASVLVVFGPKLLAVGLFTKRWLSG